MGEDYVKFGHVRGGAIKAGPGLIWGTSPVVKARSGQFVINNAGVIDMAGDGADEIFGAAESAPGTQTTGAPVDVVVDPSAVYRIPIGAGTFALSMIGKTCDLKVASNVQGADLSASVDDVFIIVGGDVAGQSYVDVMLNQKERAQAGV